MSDRSSPPPYQRCVWGFATRLYVHTNLPKISALQTEGLSLAAVADVLNAKGRRSMNGVPWDANSVEAVIALDRRIRYDDAHLRAERAAALRRGG